MSSLIITVMAIALTAAILMVTVNYLPAWQPAAAQMQAVAGAGFNTLEKAHYLASKAAGFEPAPTADADGGVVANLSAYYPFLPNAPAGYAWKYGNDSVSGYNWLCLYATASDTGAKASWEALGRLKALYSAEQYFVHTGGAASCGTATNAAEPTYPAQFSATLFVRYVPGA